MTERAIVAHLQKQRIIISKTAIHNRLVALGANFPEIKHLAKRRKAKKLDSLRPGVLKYVISCKQNRSTSSIKKALDVDCCDRTVRKYLKSRGDIRLLRPSKRPKITIKQSKRRREWASSYLTGNIDWSEVFFGDKKNFTLDGPGWRPRM